MQQQKVSTAAAAAAAAGPSVLLTGLNPFHFYIKRQQTKEKNKIKAKQRKIQKQKRKMQRSSHISSKSKTNAAAAAAAMAQQHRLRSLSKTTVKRKVSTMKTASVGLHTAAIEHRMATNKRVPISSSSSNLVGNIPIERKMAMTNLCAGGSRIPLKTRELVGKSTRLRDELEVPRLGNYKFSKNPYEIPHIKPQKTQNHRTVENAKQLFQPRYHHGERQHGGENAVQRTASRQTTIPATNTTNTITTTATKQALSVKHMQSLHVPSNKSMPYLKTNTSSCLNNMRAAPQRLSMAATSTSIALQSSKINKSANGLKAQPSTGGKARHVRSSVAKKSNNNVPAKAKIVTLQQMDTARRKQQPQQHLQQQQTDTQTLMAKSTTTAHSSRPTNAATHLLPFQYDLSPRKSATPPQKSRSSAVPKKSTTTATTTQSSNTGQAAEAIKSKWELGNKSQRAASRTTTISSTTSNSKSHRLNRSTTDSNRTYTGTATPHSKAPTTTTGTVGSMPAARGQDVLEIVNAIQIPRLEGGGIKRNRVVVSLSHLFPKVINTRNHQQSISEFLSTSTIETGEPSSEFLNSLWASDTSVESIALPTPKRLSVNGPSSVSTYGRKSLPSATDSIVGIRNPDFQRYSSTSNEIFAFKVPRRQLRQAHEVVVLPMDEDEEHEDEHEQETTKSNIKILKQLRGAGAGGGGGGAPYKSKTHLDRLITPNSNDVVKYNKSKIQQRRDAIWQEWVQNQCQNECKNQNSKTKKLF